MKPPPSARRCTADSAAARYLNKIETVASRERSALLEGLLPVPSQGTNREFIIAARLEEFDTISTAADAGLRERITANADLAALAQEGMAIVGLLDGLNAIRFERQPLRLAAYTRARNVFGPFTRGGELPDEQITGSIPPAPRADDAAA